MSFKPAEFTPAQLQAMQWLGYRRWLPRAGLPLEQVGEPAPVVAVTEMITEDKAPTSPAVAASKTTTLTTAVVEAKWSLTLNSAFTLIEYEALPSLLLPAVWGASGALSLWQAPVEGALISKALAFCGLSPLAEILQQAQAYLDDNPSVQVQKIDKEALNQFALPADCYIIFGRVLAQQLPPQLLARATDYWVLEHPNACLQKPMLKAQLWRTLAQIKESGLL